jgi:riboflavin biosynthesis pyrimidine reductase
MPLPRSKFHVYSNFVTTLDGIVSLQVKGHSAGGDISGFSAEDRMIMGLLRAVADTVIVGSGTLAADPRHIWTAEDICPELKNEYRRVRSALGRNTAPLNVLVSASGRLDLRLPVFASGRVPVLVLTTVAGAKRLMKQRASSGVEIRAVRRAGLEIPPAAILEELGRLHSGKRILLEGGPRLLAAFYKARLLNEQFLTQAPQIAGRNLGDPRLSLVMGQTFAPGDPLWGSLIDLRRGAGLLFLRYAFAARPHSSGRVQ